MTYAIPLMSRLGERRSSRTMILFPLKALANDQLAKLRRFVDAAERLAESGRFAGATLKRLRGMANVTVRVCDGDTSEREREMIRAEKTQLILTNRIACTTTSSSATPRSGPRPSGRTSSGWWWTRRTFTAASPAATSRTCFDVSCACARSATTARSIVHERHDLESGSARARPHHSRPGRGHNLGRARGREGDGAVAAPEQNQQTQTQDEGVSARRRSPCGSRRPWWPGWFAARVQCLCFVSARKLTEVIVRDVKAQLVRAGQQELALRVDSYRARVQGGGETRLGTSARRGRRCPLSSAPRRSRWASTSER